MSFTTPAPFMDFDFHEMYYHMAENYRPNLVEQWFAEGVSICNRPVYYPSDRGPALAIEQWVDRDARSNETRPNKDPYVLLQVVQMMPLRMNSADDASMVLHELVVVSWSCAEDAHPFNPFSERFRLTKRSEEQFYLVLNRWVSLSFVHTFKRGHLALVFTRDMYLKMLEYSKELHRQLQEEVDWGLVVTLGRTIQEISVNLNEYHRARALIRRVYDLVNVAYVTIKDASTNPLLQEVGMFFTDTLDGIKPPPSPSPFSYD